MRIEIIAATSLHRSEEEVTWVERAPGDTPPSVPVAALGVADLTNSGDGAAAAPGEVAGEGEPQAGEGGTGEKKSRRRRRGGRRRRKSSFEAESSGEGGVAPTTLEAPEVPVTGVPAEPAAEPTPAQLAGVGGEALAAERPRKRRRGGRRHRKVTPEAVGSEGDTPVGATAGTSPSDALPEGPAGEEKVMSRRRRRRRTSRFKARTEGKPGEGGGAAGHEGTAESEEHRGTPAE